MYMAPLQELFETHAIVKILDFLTVFKDFEYTKTDIAKETEISRRTLYEVFPILEKYELVILTRSFGAVKFYKLNTQSSISRLLIMLADEISLYQAEKENDIKLTSDIQLNIQNSSVDHISQRNSTLKLTIIKAEGSSSDLRQLIQGKINLTDDVAVFKAQESPAQPKCSIQVT
jgi:hypothetical protein